MRGTWWFPGAWRMEWSTIGSVTWDENSYGRGYVHALDGANGEHLWSSEVLPVEATLHS